MSFRALKYLLLHHSAIYTALLIVAISVGLDQTKYVLGWARGIGSIIMSLLCVDAVRRRVIPLWLGVRSRSSVASVPLRAHRFPVCGAACSSACSSLNAIWSRTLIWQ